ncbi:MAG: nuclear transport factor 2 family protein [Bacteroidia bacterium]|nr:nuclear transport factor 2 family protein [Bacteroidia bacterium]
MKKLLSLLFSFIIASILLFACNSQTSFDELKETAAILKLHNLQRDYHFNKDSNAFVNQMSENFISVNRGEITHPKKAETLSRYHAYFSSVEFVKWDDVNEPIIKFSEDGSLAYTIVDKIVRTRYNNGTGEEIEGETHFAWTAIYRKTAEGWKIENVSSTNKPPS